MRLLITTIACATCVIAQTKVVDIPVQKPTAMPHAPVPRHRIRQAVPPGTAPSNAKTPNVPPNAPVVTLAGVCEEPKPKSACETVITREDLDRFVNAFAPDVPETVRGRMAVQYARILAFSALAEQQGFQKNPVLAKELDLQLKLVRMRILASAFMQNLQNQTTSIAESEVQKYYDDHRDQYQQAQVRRLSVPLSVPTEDGRPLDRSAVKAEVEVLRNRAVAGEDFNQLQQDAYQHLRIQATPPPANALVLRRSNLQGDEAKAFDLNPGEISPVLDLPAAFAVVKIESKEPAPMESVRQEIEVALRGGRMQNEVRLAAKKITAKFNLEYLGMPSQPDLFGLTAINPAVNRASLQPTSGTRP